LIARETAPAIAARYVEDAVALAPVLGVVDLLSFRADVEVRAQCLAECLCANFHAAQENGLDSVRKGHRYDRSLT
jgi:hypothetical protein